MTFDSCFVWQLIFLMLYTNIEVNNSINENKTYFIGVFRTTRHDWRNEITENRDWTLTLHLIGLITSNYNTFHLTVCVKFKSIITLSFEYYSSCIFERCIWWAIIRKLFKICSKLMALNFVPSILFPYFL